MQSEAFFKYDASEALLCKSVFRIFVPKGFFKHGWTIIFEAASFMLVDKWRIR